MASRFGPYIPLTNLVFYVDPLNVKSYPGSGTTAYNLIDNQTATLSNVTFSGGAFSNVGTGVVAGTASYNLSLSGGYTVIQFMNPTTRQGGYFNYLSGSNSITMSSLGLNNMKWQTYASGGDLYSDEAHSLSDSEIRKILPGIKIIKYPQHTQVRNIEDELDSTGRLCILFLTEGPTTGHWFCLHKTGDHRLEFFDSYGLPPDGVSVTVIPLIPGTL